MQIDEDTHLSLRARRPAVIGSVPLEKTYRRSLFVRSHDRTARTSPSTFPFLPSSQCQRADPGILLRGQRRWKQSFLIFGNRRVASGCPAAPLPYPEITAAAAARPRRSALAGYMAGPFGCQHPKMTKPTKIERVHFCPGNTRRAFGPLSPPVAKRWEAARPLQGRRHRNRPPSPETCRNCSRPISPAAALTRRTGAPAQ